MSDYTLPCLPGPAIAKKCGPQVEAYGHACAEAARAPLLARIAELEAAKDSDYEFDAMRIDRDRLHAEVEDWRKLLDPANLHANLLQGKPAKLTRAQLAHLLGQDYTALLAELEALRADKARIDEAQNQSLRIEPFEMRTPGGDDTDVGWRIYTHHQQAPHLREVACHYADDLRAAIDAAIAARKGEGVEGA